MYLLELSSDREYSQDHFIALENVHFEYLKLYLLELLLKSYFLPTRLASGLLNKDPTVWLDGAVPAKTSVLPSCPGKSIFAVGQRTTHQSIQIVVYSGIIGG